MYKKEGEPYERPRCNGFHGKDAGPESISKTSSSKWQSGIITTLQYELRYVLCSFIQGRDGTKRPFKNQRRMDQTGSSDEGCRNVISVINRRRAVIISGI